MLTEVASALQCFGTGGLLKKKGALERNMGVSQN